MEFVLLWLFISIEKIAAFLTIGGSIFFYSVLAYLGTYVLSFLMSKDLEGFKAFNEKTKKHRKISVVFAVIGAILFTVSSLLPTKKELAIIVGGGMVYQVLTSESAKEIGGKSIQLIKKQIDEALKDETIKESADSLKEQAIEKAKQAVKEQVDA